MSNMRVDDGTTRYLATTALEAIDQIDGMLGRPTEYPSMAEVMHEYFCSNFSDYDCRPDGFDVNGIDADTWNEAMDEALKCAPGHAGV